MQQISLSYPIYPILVLSHMQILSSSSNTWFAIDEMNTFSPASSLEIK